MEQFEKAISLKKKFEYAYSDLGHAYIGMGKTDKAEEQMKILVNLNTNLATELAQELELTLFTPKITLLKGKKCLVIGAHFLKIK